MLAFAFSVPNGQLCEDAPGSTRIPNTSRTVSWWNCVPQMSLLSAFSSLGVFFCCCCCSVPCQSNTSVFMCLTGQLSLHFWYFLTFSSLFPRCCQAHDRCYEEALKLESCKFLWDSPYTERYRFTCSDKEITCDSTSTSTSLQTLAQALF